MNHERRAKAAGEQENVDSDKNVFGYLCNLFPQGRCEKGFNSSHGRNTETVALDRGLKTQNGCVTMIISGKVG